MKLIDSWQYILVLEYANGGDLRDYLKTNFTSLEWKDKIKMALNITCGLQFLHSKGIVHRDLVILCLQFYFLIIVLKILLIIL